jgi:hypothetical protein
MHMATRSESVALFVHFLIRQETNRQVNYAGLAVAAPESEIPKDE